MVEEIALYPVSMSCQLCDRALISQPVYDLFISIRTDFSWTSLGPFTFANAIVMSFKSKGIGLSKCTNLAIHNVLNHKTGVKDKHFQS